MRVSFTPDGWKDYCSWADDRKTLRRINRLIDESVRDPGVGVGKPERLSHDLAGYWSRRISAEHRLVYKVTGDYEIIVVQACDHY